MLPNHKQKKQQLFGILCAFLMDLHTRTDKYVFISIPTCQMLAQRQQANRKNSPKTNSFCEQIVLKVKKLFLSCDFLRISCDILCLLKK